MKTITEIAHRLVELMKDKKFLEAQEELFDEDCHNEEPENTKSRSVNGLNSILQKERKFLQNIKEWNRYEVSNPIIASDFFSVQLMLEVTLINNTIISVNEIIVYEIKNGKIIHERFFF